jgi:peptide/nickel transport system substrate-binding protein
VEKANKLLDDMGLNKKDADGFRLGPDGKTFVIPIEHGAHAPDIGPGAELVAQHLIKVGLKTTVKAIDSNLWGTRTAANEIQATFIWDVQPMWADNTWTDYALDNKSAPLWNLWFTSGGKQGEEPPAAAKALYTDILNGRNQAVPYSDADKKLSADMYKNYGENVWIFPLAEKVNYAMVVSQKLGNMPKSGQAIGADYSMEQFFFK